MSIKFETRGWERYNCRKLKFDHITKWYMHKPESVLKNETHKNFQDFDIQTDHLLLLRCPNLAKKKRKKKEKRSCHIVDFAGSTYHSENQRKQKKRQVFGSNLRTEKAVEHNDYGSSNSNWCVCNGVKGLVKRLEELEIGGRTKTIQRTALMKLTRKLRRVQETWGNLLPFRLQWKDIGCN